jgi:hypothetical protein
MELLGEVAEQAGLHRPVVQCSATPDGRAFYGILSPGDYGVREKLWDLLRNLYPHTGLWPFLGHESPMDWEWETGASVRDGASVSHMLDRLAEYGAINVLEDPGSRQDINLQGAEGIAAVVAGAPYARGEVMGQNFRYAPEWVCLVEARHSFELPLVLHSPSTPNWLGNPLMPSLGYAEHAATLKDWNARFGAVLFYLGASAMVLQVDRPPVGAADIARVALEQSAYCPDLDQVIGSPGEIAARQVTSRHWFFWWD